MASETVAELSNSLREIKQSLKFVTVQNGGGLPINIKREDFYQKVYNKPERSDLVELEEKIIQTIGKMIKEAPMNSIRTITRDLTLIGGMIVILLKMFGIIK